MNGKGRMRALRVPGVRARKVCQGCRQHFYVTPFHLTKRYCSLQCSRSHRFGDETRHAQFWDQVQKSEGCWIFTGWIMSAGYGEVSIRRKRILAHRLSYTLTKGPIPDGMKVCHTCDVPTCVRPEHLFLGTDAVNKADAVAKGRHSYGERSKHAKLNAEAVRAIRREFRKEGTHKGARCNARELAKRYGVQVNAIEAIIYRGAWKQVQ